MPEISLFYEIRVTMYYEDHNPPHFHAEYNGNQRWTSIKSNQSFGLIWEGDLNVSKSSTGNPI